MDIEMPPGAFSSDPRLILVEAECVGLLWPILSDYFSFLENDVPQLYTMNSLLDSIEEGQMQLWAIGDDMDYVASGITQIVSYPANTILDVIGWGGRDVNSWLALMKKLMAWGEMQGCSVLRVTGRKGWTRLLKDYNFNGEKVMISTSIVKYGS